MDKTHYQDELQKLAFASFSKKSKISEVPREFSAGFPKYS